MKLAIDSLVFVQHKSPSWKVGPHEQNFPSPPREVPQTKYFSCRLLGGTVSHFWGNLACSGGQCVVAWCCLLLKAKSPSWKVGPHEQNFPFPPWEVPPTKHFKKIFQLSTTGGTKFPSFGETWHAVGGSVSLAGATIQGQESQLESWYP